MKNYNLFITTACLLMAFSSCKKDDNIPPVKNVGDRTVKFELYTSKNFSGSNQLVTFKLKISDAGNTMWDSTLAPMTLKAIPTAANKIVIEKKVPGNSNAQLVAGFVYTLENVGISWYNEVFNSGEKTKMISFDFR